jgi:hypothetical protein
MGLFSDRSFDGDWWRALGLLTLLYVSLLLRYRVTDEWKDFVHDARNYPGLSARSSLPCRPNRTRIQSPRRTAEAIPRSDFHGA